MRPGKQEAARHSWFPLDLERYNRNPALTAGETTALRRHAPEHHPTKAALHEKVRRLIQPVEDLFSHTKLRPAIRPFLVLYLLREMNRRGRSFWGWTTDEWIETISDHPQQQHMAALAYILCGFTDLDTLTYLDGSIIPVLCRKAGIPINDVRGRITSHRARSTIASQLFNAKEPMTLFELQEWLGHSSPEATQHYVKITPTKLAKAYGDAGYFARNVRAIEVLIDQESVRNGQAVAEPWKFYDLGHGYCSYDFFEQCPHRMACAKCSFYLPKASTAAALLEGKSNLLRMRQEIPLTDAEIVALDDGVSALDSLLNRLADVPTPSGKTPLQIREQSLVQIAGT
jgi:hypothetical protein